MGYEEHYQLNGYDVSIYGNVTKGYTLEIEYPCGEPIAGYDKLCTVMAAQDKAIAYIKLNPYDKPHCDNRYCIDAFVETKGDIKRSNNPLGQLRDLAIWARKTTGKSAKFDISSWFYSMD